MFHGIKIGTETYRKIVRFLRAQLRLDLIKRPSEREKLKKLINLIKAIKARERERVNAMMPLNRH